MERLVRQFYDYPLNWVDEISTEKTWDRWKNQKILTLTPATNGILVKSLVQSPRKQKGRDGDLEHWRHEKGHVDMWISLPDDLMVSILVRLPFSSFCSMKSVCKGWNTLIRSMWSICNGWNTLMPHSELLITRTKDTGGTTPLAIMLSMQNRWACYNPVSHQWHHLPTDFGTSSNGRGDHHLRTIVLGSSNGLLLVAATEVDKLIDHSRWVVNPVNKSERQVITPKKYRGRPLSFHLQVDNQQSSFKYFQLLDYSTKERVETGVVVYDSKSNSWLRYFPHKMFPWQAWDAVWSIVEFGGRVYTLGLDSYWRHPCIEVLWRESEWFPDTHWCTTYIDLPDYTPQERHHCTFRVGHLFVRDGSLLVAEVLEYSIEPKQRGMEFGGGMRVGIWQLVDSYPRGHAWKEIAVMPKELNEVFWTGLYEPDNPHNDDIRDEKYRPQVNVQGDFMWVANPYLEVLNAKDEKMDRLRANCGVMYHLPSNSWWKVPNYWDSPNCKLDRSGQDQMLHRFCATRSSLRCQPFLFSPCMDLIA